MNDESAARGVSTDDVEISVAPPLGGRSPRTDPGNMQNTSPPQWLRVVAALLGSFAFVGGVTSLLGWALDIPRLTDWEANGISIQPNASVAAIAASTALLLLTSNLRKIAVPFGTLVGLIGITAVFQNATLIDLGINSQLTFGHEWGRLGVLIPGLMGTPASVSWTLLGLAIVLASLGRTKPINGDASPARFAAAALALITLTVASLSLIGYLYGAEVLYMITRLTVIAMQTAAFIFAISLGFILLIFETGPMHLLLDRGPAGSMMRRIVPAVVTISLILGFLRLFGQNAGWYDAPFGTAARTVIEIALLLGLLWWAGYAVRRQVRRAEAHKQATRERDERLEGILGSLTDAFFVLDKDGRFAFVNDEVVKRFGMPQEEVVGKQIWEMFPAAIGNIAHERLNRALAERTTVEYEVFYEPWQKWFADKAYPTADGGLAVYSRDITEKKESEAALRRHEEDLRQLADAMPQVVWVANAGGRVQYYNERAKNFSLGAANGDGQFDWELGVHKDDVESTVRAWLRAVAENHPYEHEHRILMADGTYRWHLSRAVPVVNGDGKSQRWFGTATDIHDLKTEEEKQKFLFSITEKIRIARNVDELLADISKALGEHLGVHRCLFNEIDLENDTATVHSDYHPTSDSVAGTHTLSDYSAIAGESLKSGRIVVNRDTKTDPRTADYFDRTYGPAGELSYIAVPMTRDGHWVATLWCSDDKARDWTDREVALLENVAERTWAAVERARAEEALRREADAKTRLQELSGELVRQGDLKPLLQEILAAAAELTSTDKGNIQIYDPDTGTLRIFVHQGLGRRLVEHFAEDGWDGSCAEAVRRFDRVLVEDVEKLEDLHGTIGLEIVLEDGIRSIQCTPLVSRDGRLLGMLNNHNRKPGRPNEDQLRYIDLLARQAADLIEREQAGEAIRESEEKFRTLFESIDEGFVIVEVIFDENEKPIDYRFIQANPAFTRLTGLPEDALGKTARELVPNLEEFWFETYGKVASTGEAVRFEHKSDVMGRWFDVYASRVGDSLQRVAIVFNNITERKLSEEAVRESEARFRHMADNAPVMVWVTEADGQCTFLSRTWYDFTGQTPETGLGYGWLDATHPEDKERAATIFLEASAKCKPFRLEYRLRHTDGEYRWAIDSARPRFSESGVFLGYIGSVIDITERKRAEETLSNLVESCPFGIYIVDSDFRIANMNIGSQQGAFINVRPVIGRPFDEAMHILWPPDVAEDIISKFRRTLETGEPYYSRDFIRPRGDIERVESYEWELHRIALPDGTFGVTCYYYDSTRLREAERAVRESENRLKAVFEQLPVAVGVMDMDGKWVRSNPLMEILVPQAIPSILHDRVLRWHALDEGGNEIPPENWPGKRALRGETVSPGLDMQFPADDAEQRWMRVSAAPFRSETGEMLGATCVVEDITERKRSEEALRVAESRLRLSLTGADLGVWAYSTETGEFWADHRARVMHGYQPNEELTFEKAGECVHPDDKERAAGSFQKAFEKREKLQHELRIVTPDGNIRWIASYAEFIEESQTFYGISQDITDRKQAEQALRESEEEFRRLANAVPQIVWVAGADGKTTYVNEQWTEFSGLTLEDTADPEKLAKVIHPDDAEAVFGGWAKAFESGTPYEVEGRMLDHNTGEYCWFLMRGEPAYGVDGRVVGWYGTSTDITANREASEALRQSEEKFRTMAQTTPAIIWTAAPDGRITYQNPQWLEYTGLTPEQNESNWAELVVHPDDYEMCVTEWRHSLETGEDYEVEVRNRRRDGEYRWFVTRAVPIKDESGNIVSWFGSATDIDDQKRTQEALSESEKGLRQSQQRFHLAQKAGNVGIWDWNAESGETYWSETMWAFYGVEPRAANPNDSFWADHLHPDDRERVTRQVAETLGSKALHYNDEFRIIREDGTTRWIGATATLTRDADGKPTRMYGVNIDITERKSAEEKIRLSERQLRLVTDSMPALISYVDKEQRYRFANKTYTEWFNRPFEEIIGRTVTEVIGASAYEKIKPHVEEVMAGKEISFETVLNYQTAGTRYVQVAYVPDRGSDGSVQGFYALINDLSEIKRSQDLLRASQERFRNVVTSFTDHAIFSTDPEGVIDSWNPGATNIFGYSDEEAIGQNVEVLFTPGDRAKNVPADEMTRARATGRASDERWHLRKDGSRFYASGSTTPLYFGRTLSGFGKIASDLTERKRAAEELQRAHDELEIRVAERTRELAETNLALVAEVEERKTAEREGVQLLQRVVTTQEEERTRIARDLHDQLGQRLTALRLKIASLPEAFHDADLLKKRTERVQGIAEGIDAEVSFLAWELRPAALDELGLAEAIKAHMNEWSRHYEIAADFHASGLGTDRLGQAVETHLYRIVQEALNNAAKHASATEVTILLEKREDSAVLIIEDNGIGFDLRDGTRIGREGKGLGLAGMRERAVLIGGELEIESGVGHGTTIFVRVPVKTKDGDNENG